MDGLTGNSVWLQHIQAAGTVPPLMIRLCTTQADPLCVCSRVEYTLRGWLRGRLWWHVGLCWCLYQEHFKLGNPIKLFLQQFNKLCDNYNFCVSYRILMLLEVRIDLWQPTLQGNLHTPELALTNRRHAVYSYAGQHQKAQSLQLLDHCAQDFPFSNIIFFNGNFSQNFIWGSKCEQAHTCWFVRTKHEVHPTCMQQLCWAPIVKEGVALQTTTEKPCSHSCATSMHTSPYIL